MNKNRVNDNLNKAYDVLAKVGIAQNGQIKKTFRGQISTFGAAVTMGSLPSAIAFFCQQGSASVDRTLLIKAIINVMGEDKVGGNKPEDLYKYVVKQKDTTEVKEEILNAAISLKLAMNLYKLA